MGEWMGDSASIVREESEWRGDSVQVVREEEGE